jgi:hypothetical protein
MSSVPAIRYSYLMRWLTFITNLVVCQHARLIGVLARSAWATGWCPGLSVGPGPQCEALPVEWDPNQQLMTRGSQSNQVLHCIILLLNTKQPLICRNAIGYRMDYTLVTALRQLQWLKALAKDTNLCDVMLCQWGCSSWHFKELFCLQLQGQEVQDEGKQIFQNIGIYAPSNTPPHITELHSRLQRLLYVKL